MSKKDKIVVYASNDNRGAFCIVGKYPTMQAAAAAIVERVTNAAEGEVTAVITYVFGKEGKESGCRAAVKSAARGRERYWTEISIGS
jgi:hypothetical protein